MCSFIKARSKAQVRVMLLLRFSAPFSSSLRFLTNKGNSTLNLKKVLHQSSQSFSSRSKKMTDKLIWIDCEMTGLDVNKDSLLEIALVLTDTDLNIVSLF